jgi:RNA-binding protein 8A
MGLSQRDADYEGVEMDEEVPSAAGRAQRSVEGWIIVVTGLHEEASEEEVSERFADHGLIRNLRLELDRRTGYVKGYALIEYETYKEAKAAIDAQHGSSFLGVTLECDFAFVRPPAGRPRGRHNQEGIELIGAAKRQQEDRGFGLIGAKRRQEE